VQKLHFWSFFINLFFSIEQHFDALEELAISCHLLSQFMEFNKAAI